MATMENLLQDVKFDVLGAGGVEPTGIAYNSRQVQPGDAFFCVVGLKSDGHAYAADAVARGCSALVVQHRLELDVPQYVVDDSRSALALAADRFYGQPSSKMDLVGVTGTNGKTTTTYLVDWVAKSRGLKTGVIGTVETRIGDQKLHSEHTTPESADLQQLLGRMLSEGCQEVAMEVSSHAIHLDRILGTRFAVVAFSNLTQDHLDYHVTMENYFQAKAMLFTKGYASKAAICIDDEYGKRLAQMAHDAGLDVVTCGFDKGADVHPIDVGYHTTHTAIKVQTPRGTYSFDYPLIGRFNVENVLLALAICCQLDYDLQQACEALQQVPQVPGRLERVSVDGLDPKQMFQRFGFSVYVDYAHTPDSIEKAIDALRPITRGRLIIVFGCGGDRDRTKRPKMGAAACNADLIVVTSDNPRSEDPQAIIDDILPGMTQGEGRYQVQADRRQAIDLAVHLAQHDDAVLIAGKGHEDYQLVGDQVLQFDDRVVAAQVLAAL